MPKRSGPSSPSPSKRSKLSHGQHRLDQFFSSSERTPTKGHTTQGSTAFQSRSREIIDVDLLDDDDAGGDDSTRDALPMQQPAAPAAVAALPPRQTAEPATASTSTLPAKTPQKIFGAPTLAPASAEPLEYQPLVVDPPFFDLVACPWHEGSPAPYSFLTHTLTTLTATRSRIIILQTLTNTLRIILKFHAESLLATLHLLSNSLSSPYLPIELGLGPSVLSKAIQHISGLTPAALKRLYNKSGDPGDVAFAAKSNVRTLIPHPPLTIMGVYDSLLNIAHAKGTGAAKQKQSIVEKLLVAAKGEEVRFLVRTLSMNLRVGAVRTSILTALARALVLTPPVTLAVPIPAQSSYSTVQDIVEAVKPLPLDGKKVPDDSRERLTDLYLQAESLLKRVYVQHPDYNHIAAALCNAGLDGLAERVPLTVGV